MKRLSESVLLDEVDPKQQREGTTAAEVAADTIKQLEARLADAERAQRELAKQSKGELESRRAELAAERSRCQCAILRDQVVALTAENASLNGRLGFLQQQLPMFQQLPVLPQMLPQQKLTQQQPASTDALYFVTVPSGLLPYPHYPPYTPVSATLATLLTAIWLRFAKAAALEAR